MQTLDVNNGWLMKIDNMANIQMNTVHGNVVRLSRPLNGEKKKKKECSSFNHGSLSLFSGP